MANLILYEYVLGPNEGSYDAYGANWLAQTFTPQVTHKIEKVQLVLSRGVDASPGTLTVGIRATSGGNPTGGDLCSGTIDGNGLTTDLYGAWYDITFSSSYELLAGIKYAIVVRAPSGNTDNRALWWLIHGGLYTRGQELNSDDSGTSWVAWEPYWDFLFQEWGDFVAAPKDIVALEAIRNVEMSAQGRFYIDESGNAKYESRYARNA